MSDQPAASHPSFERNQPPDFTMRIMRWAAAVEGVSWDKIVSDAGLPTHVNENRNAYLTGLETEALQRSFVDATRHVPNLWLRMGLQQGPMSHGPLGLAALTAPTLHVGLRCLVDYGALSTALLRCHLIEANGAVAAVEAEPVTASSHLGAFHLERAVGATFRFINDLCPGSSPIERLELPLADDDVLSARALLIGVPVRLGEPTLRLILKPGASRLTLPMADALLHRMNLELCAGLLESQAEEDTLVDALFLQLLRSLPKLPSPEVASRSLGLSERTLHRRLAEQGLAYGAVCDKARRCRATYLLERTNSSIKMIAQAVGYAENASFTRAFKRWTGMSPLQFRRGGSDQALR